MFKRSIGMVATLALGALLAPVLASAQSTPRTTWGDPDLRGVWNNGTLTPFQRPEALGTQEYITEEEAATAAQRRASIATLCVATGIASAVLLLATVRVSSIVSATTGWDEKCAIMQDFPRKCVK